MTTQPPPPRYGSAPLPRHRRHSRQTEVSSGRVAGRASAVYTSWIARVLASTIDSIPAVVLFGIGFALLLGTQKTQCSAPPTQYDLGDLCSTGASTFGQLATSVAALVWLACYVWNYGYRQGTNGSTVGKSIMRFKVVSEKTGRPLGFGRSLLRQLAHVVDAIPFYVGFLFPIWDVKRQTIADKIMKTVCVPAR